VSTVAMTRDSDRVRDATLQKPALRGVSHQIGFFVSLLATAVLLVHAADRKALIAAAVFGASLANLLGTSALYHRLHWSPSARQRMRSLDHAAIFVLIAGGYTPLLALVPSPSGGHAGLVMMWAAAALGDVKSLVWLRAPKWITAVMAVGVGWLAILEVSSRTAAVGWLCVGLLVVSGSIYSLGAIVYAVRRPDPLPRIFGYHEVFHALVIAASVCLYAHVWLVIT
jgi:hemolysin III